MLFGNFHTLLNLNAETNKNVFHVCYYKQLRGQEGHLSLMTHLSHATPLSLTTAERLNSTDTSRKNNDAEK